MRQIDTIVIHHAVTPRDLDILAAVSSFSRNHFSRGLHRELNGFGNYVAYHYVIVGNGDMQNTRPEEEVGYHASDLAINNRSLGLCLSGNFDIEDPSSQQITRLIQLLRELNMRYPAILTRVFPHRQFASKTCPGTHVTNDLLQSWVMQAEQGGAPTNGPQLDLPSPWAAEAWRWAIDQNIIRAGKPLDLITTDEARLILERLGLLTSTDIPFTRERFVVALYRLLRRSQR